MSKEEFIADKELSFSSSFLHKVFFLEQDIGGSEWIEKTPSIRIVPLHVVSRWERVNNITTSIIFSH